LVTATTPTALPAATDMIGFAEARAPGGDVLVVSRDEQARYRLGEVYAVGQIDDYTRFRWVVASHWLVLLPLAVLAMFALGFAWRGRLELEERRRYARIPEGQR